MLYIFNSSTDPYFNMACEEYFLKSFDTNESIFMLWQNNPAIIIGKNQNTLEEINLNYIKKNNIPVVRRLSGGGAVYHDKGNLNFTFITKYDSNFFDSLDIFTKPVICVLKSLGIEAELKGRNDISIDGRKFSGNSQVVAGSKILHHGTIMLDVNTDILTKALKVSAAKIESKGIKSIRKRVTNINAHLQTPISPKEFAALLYSYLAKEEQLTDYELTLEDKEQITLLKNSKYFTDAWNYGYSPAYSFSKEIKLKSGLIKFSFQIENYTVAAASITGDFFGSKDCSELAAALIGVSFTKEALIQRFTVNNPEEYIWQLKKEDVPELIDKLFE